MFGQCLAAAAVCVCVLSTPIDPPASESEPRKPEEYSESAFHRSRCAFQRTKTTTGATTTTSDSSLPAATSSLRAAKEFEGVRAKVEQRTAKKRANQKCLRHVQHPVLNLSVFIAAASPSALTDDATISIVVVVPGS